MNEISEEMKGLISKLTAFDKMYQQVRIVDPINKRVLDQQSNEVVATTESCYSIWTTNEVCKNCISMRAYNEDNTFLKIEYTQNKIFMVTSIPVKLAENRVVIELLKDVTDSMVVTDLKSSESNEMKNLLDKANIAAVTDGLTKTYNKRYIIENLPTQIVTSHLENEPLSIVLVDLDFFKNINDTYGHLAGDYILQECSLILKNNIRQDKDWLARFGGEEFLICLPQTDKEMALVVAERMRKAIEKEIFIYNHVEIQLTSSFGVFSISDEKVKDYDELITGADKNLYEAKQTGRNRVIG